MFFTELVTRKNIYLFIFLSFFPILSAGSALTIAIISTNDIGVNAVSSLRMQLYSCILSFIAVAVFVFFTVRLLHRQMIIMHQSNQTESPFNTFKKHKHHELSPTISVMATELVQSQPLIEQDLDEKTVPSAQVNQLIKLLADCSQVLNVAQLDAHCFNKALGIIRQSEHLSAIKLEIQNNDDSCWQIIDGNIDEQLSWFHLSLEQDEEKSTVLSWQCEKTQQPSPILIQSIATVLHHSILLQQNQKQYAQFLLMEERAIIARELHDSLAQSLLFLRIQLTLFKRIQANDTEQAVKIIADFEHALTNSYQHLRELLITFRLPIQTTNLHQAIKQLILPLQVQGSAKIHMNGMIPSLSLSAQQQLHALQIVREAVINAIKHANANNIDINYENTSNGNNIFSIIDDGKGIEDINQHSGHYGLTIMHERAKHLGGYLTIQRRKNGGTAIILNF